MTQPQTLEQCAKRLIVEILLEGEARYWRRRAQTFAAIGTPECDEISRACYAKARFVEMGGETNEWSELLDRELSQSEAA